MVAELERSRLVVGAGELWAEGTQARFLDAVADGSLPAEAFQRWLVQDYFFAQGLTRAQGAMLARAPRAAFQVLIDGLAALALELEWFEAHAQRLNLKLDASPHPVAARYVDFLTDTARRRAFPVLAVVLFGVEASYLAAWSALAAAGPYAEFIARWSNPQFAAYVRRLAQLAEDTPDPQQQDAFNVVLQHERDFWRMTWGEAE
jgi:thiaminase/transcriptional activator TenA